MDAIFSLPMVLVHQDFGTCNIMVDEETCRLTGVLDWAEAEMGPFGQNLCSLEHLMGALHLKSGWRRYEDYEHLQRTFWSTFLEEVKKLPAETLRTIKMARNMGLLRSHGFTSRLANQSPAIPIQDDDKGRYSMLSLDGSLINSTTRFDDIN